MKGEKEMSATIHQDKKGQWYFWDQIGYYEYGPYLTSEEAQEELEKYCKELNYSEEKEENK